jgi:hypothetical protein
MNAKPNPYGVFSILGLLLLLGVATGFDALMAFLQRNLETFGILLFWSYALATIVLAAASLFLFWFVLHKAPRNVWVALIFLLSGLFVVVYPALHLIPAFRWLPLSVPVWLTSRSYIVYSGGLIAMMGLFALVLPTRGT